MSRHPSLPHRLAIVALLLPGGCGIPARLGDIVPGGADEGILLSPADFAAAPGRTGQPGASSDAAPADESSNAVAEPSPRRTNSSDAPSPAPAPMATSRAVAREPEDGQPRIVGGMIGQVNGRPIYVGEFFDPIAARLAILGQNARDRDAFIREAYRIIGERLRTMVENELIYAEADAALTDEQRTILGYWMDAQRLELIRAGGGSEKQADQYYRDTEGLSLEEKLQQERRRQIVNLRIDEVRRRVRVSWRDVERYYRDHPEEFSPKPEIELRIIAIPEADAAAAQAVREDLGRGIPFEAVASERSVRLASQGGRMPVIPLPDGLENTRLTAWTEVDAVAKTLSPGEHGGPVDVGDQLVWVYVERYEPGRKRPLFEVQDEVEQKLFEQQFREEWAGYVAGLLERGNFDDMERMGLGLLDVAITRWAPPE